MSNIITVKHFLLDEYFKLDISNLMMTNSYLTLEELKNNTSFVNIFQITPHDQDYLLLLDGTILRTYLKTNHPELFI